MLCVSVCCRTAGLAPSAADQEGYFHDILLHGCPQSEGLAVLRKASLSLYISMRMYNYHSALSACIKHTSLKDRPPRPETFTSYHL